MRGSTCRLACTFQGSSPMAAISSSAEEDQAGKSGRSGGLGGQEAKGSGSRAQVDAQKQSCQGRTRPPGLIGPGEDESPSALKSHAHRVRSSWRRMR
jgi:hypothetical protein